MSIKLILPFVLAASLFSCQKGADEPTETSRKALIIGSWQLTGNVETPATYDFDSDGIKDSDTYKFMGTCFTDNLTVFRPDGNCEENEGPTKCEAADPQVILAPWTLSADEKILTIDDDVYTVVEVNATTMKLSYTDVVIDTQVTTVATLTRR